MNPKQKSLIVGALLGAAVGALGGYLFTRGVAVVEEENRSQELPVRRVPPGEIVRLVISILGVLRGIAELGERI